MSTSDRLRELRRCFKMSQEEFGKRIGVSNTAISKMEKNEPNLTEQTIKSICREFHVNYSWLTEGIGDTFYGTPTSVVDEIAEEFNLDAVDKNIIAKYLELSPDQRKVLKGYLKSVFAR